jgi:nicotinamide phosphoribosyltransferase
MLDTQNPLFNEDVYKTGHIAQNPEGVTQVYSTWVPRRSRIEGVDYAIFFGLTNYLKYLKKRWEPFFDSRLASNCFITEYSEVMRGILGYQVPVEHFRRLYELGRLPISIRAVHEGTQVPIRTPALVIESTHPDAAWLPQFLETDFSSFLWKPITSATLSVERRRRDNEAVAISGGPAEMLPYLNHDFSYRGMSGLQDAIISGMGHLVGSDGTDTIPAAVRIAELYRSLEWVGRSIGATEHSVMCIDGEGLELETFRRILRVYSDKPVSIVSDTWNLWRVLDTILPSLGSELRGRKAPLVIRPDSGEPVKILMGDTESSDGIVRQGLVPYLLDRYSEDCRLTEKGYRLLPSYLGSVYGDSMNMQRCDNLNATMLSKKICPTDTVRGIGSFTYEYQTRDSLGQAMKATEAIVGGRTRQIFKSPVTDSGEKKSDKGRVCLKFAEDGAITGHSDCHPSDKPDGFPWLPVIDGVFESTRHSFDEIRNRTGVWG